MSSVAMPLHTGHGHAQSVLHSTCPVSWHAVARRRVYFGHQSVGRDIIAGLEALNAEHGLGLRFAQTRTPSLLAGPAFVDFLAGENTRPVTKNRALLEQLDARELPDDAIVMLKYCYVDIAEGTDVRRLLHDYRQTVELIHRRHPDVTVVHVTVPLTSNESVMKWRLKKVLGRPTLRGANARRNEYNALLRATLAGREPLFDLAAVEGDGVLEGSFTHDGGHLNAAGARAAAAALLDVLGAIATSDAA